MKTNAEILVFIVAFIMFVIGATGVLSWVFDGSRVIKSQQEKIFYYSCPLLTLVGMLIMIYQLFVQH